MSVTAVPLRPLPKGSVVKLWLALVLLVAIGVAVAWAGTSAFQTLSLPSGVTLRSIRPGSGPTITAQDVVALHYKLHVGKVEAPVIQNSRDMGQPLVTTTQGIYPGFAEGLTHMKPGGSYILSLPGGTHEQRVVPGAPFTPRDTLVFEIDVLQVDPGAAPQFLQMQRLQQLQQMQQMQQQMQRQGQGQGNSSAGEALPSADGTPGG
jgi:FKBP-type peptidyl-prolyl cis-trans isomerase FkpA